MKLSIRTEAASLLMILTMFALGIASWSTAPDRIPMHWNDAGQVDSFGGRAEGLFLLPIVAIASYALLLIVPRIDPRREHYDAFAGPYLFVRTAVLGVLFTIYLAVHLVIRGRSVDMGTIAPLAVGVLLIVVGNYLPKIKSNWFVGVRTPWTLSSEHSWQKTHRLAGFLFVLAGAAIIAGGLISPHTQSFVLPISVAIVVVAPVIYSYVVWRHDPARS